MLQIEVEKKLNFQGHKDCIYTLAPSGNSTQFFSGAGDGMVVSWDLAKDEPGQLIATVGASVYALCYLPEPNHLLIGENYEGLHKIDLATKKEITTSSLTKAAIFDIVSFGNIVITALGDGTVSILETETLKPVAHIKHSIKSARCIAVNHKANEFAVGYSDNFVRIFDLKDFSMKYEFEAHKNSVFALCYSPDDLFLLSGSRDAHLKVWDVNDNYGLHKTIVAHLYAINHICYSADHKYFATASMDKSIKIWDATKFTLLKVIDRSRHAGHGTSVNKLFWSKFENLLVSCSDDKTISIWNIKFN